MAWESLVVDMVRRSLFVCDLSGDMCFDGSFRMLIGAWSVLFFTILGQD